MALRVKRGTPDAFELELDRLIEQFIGRVTALAGIAALEAARTRPVVPRSSRRAPRRGIGPANRRGPEHLRGKPELHAPWPSSLPPAPALDVREPIGRRSTPRRAAASSRLPRRGEERARQRTIKRASLGAAVVSYLLARPGQPIAAIRDALGARPAALAMVLKYLAAEGLIRVEGASRHRIYFPQATTPPTPAPEMSEQGE